MFANRTFRAMSTASVKSSCKSPDTFSEEAISATQVKHGGEEHDKESKAMIFSFITGLKACAQKKDLYKVSRIHAEICNTGLLQKNIYLGNTLITMYAKCGAVARAREVLLELPIRDVVTWNSLIAGCAQHGYGKEALGYFQQMLTEGLSPNAITYACSLKACGIAQDIEMGERIHNEIANQGLLQNHALLGGALIDMYAKCGALVKARKSLDELPNRNVVTWNSLIAGYSQHGCGKEALGCFQQMRSEGLFPDAITYACILKVSGIAQDVAMGEKIYGEIATQGLLQKHVLLGGALVDMYAKCGALAKAREVLDKLLVRNVVTWNSLIAGYAQRGCGKEALACFQEMLSEGLSPSAITYGCSLKACSIVQDVDMGQRIHDQIATQGLLQNYFLLGGALVDMYVKCGFLTKARKVLDELPIRDVVSWSALIAGYAQHGWGMEALGCFQQMRSEGLSPNAVTYVCSLKACGIVQDVDMGQRIHHEIATQGLLQNHVLLGGALVDMYVKCGNLTKAQKVFDELLVRDVVSWSALIAGYAQQGCGEEALGCFQQMRSEGLSLDTITYACVLKACGIAQDAAMGKRIHGEIVLEGLLQQYVLLGGALVDMYAMCGFLAKARKVLEELPVRNVVPWNSLIAGYAQHGCGKEALGCFQEMRSKGLFPDASTYACVLKACCIAQDVATGERIHDEIATQGLLQKHVLLGGALVDMYAKWGALAKAQKVLEELPVRNVITWNSLIAGYAQRGCGKEALGCFQQMQSEGISPDAITFACVLNACSHSGLVDEGQVLFDSMKEKYGITPDEEHYTCMVDLFGRARHFDKALGVINKMPSSDCLSVWHALLGACRKWGDMELGRLAFKCAVELDKLDATAYVLMSNIYAAAGMQQEAQNMECIRIRNGAWKQPGRSCWIDASRKDQDFVVGNNSHPQSREISLKLQDLELKLSLERGSPDLHWVSQNISTDAKKVLLCQHYEKLAIA